MPAVRAGGERMTVFDLAELASDVGPNARNVGVMIELEGGAPGLDAVRASVGDGVGLVPRLAQRMRRVPLGCGRPVWEDVAVYLDHHVRPGPPTRRTCSTSPPRLLFEALDPAHPWWTLTVVDLPAAGRCALVWSSHHAMADGPSVLRAVLPLVQDGPTRELPPPRTVPGRARLAREAWAARVRVLGGAPRWPRRLVGLRELVVSTYVRVPASPLNRPVTAGYVLRTVDVDLTGLGAGAHSCGATINDALLWAWGRAVHRRLAADGTGPAPVVVTCTVTRPSAEIENHVGAVRIAVAPPWGSVPAELAALARTRGAASA